MADEEVFERYPVASWTPTGGETIRFPVESIQESRAKRLVEHERPYRPGAKLDDTDWRARRWTVQCVFNNTIDEPEVVQGDRPLYPDTLNLLIASFDLKETGDLVLPTRGKRRARTASYDRKDTADARDQAEVTFVFVEDNEDDVDQSAFGDPSVKAQLVRLARQTQFTAQTMGEWDEDLGDLVVFASQLESLLLAPSRTLDDIQSQVRRNRRAITRVLDASNESSARAREFNRGSETAKLWRQLVDLLDLTAKAVEEASSTLPRTKTIVVEGHTDLFSVAVDLNQDPVAVFALNAGAIEDPLDLEPGDRVRVFA